MKYGLLEIATAELLRAIPTPGINGVISSGECNWTLRSDVEGPIWLVNDPRNAELVRKGSTPYYNSNYEMPEHSFKEQDLVVVEVDLRVRTKKVKLPTWKQYVNSLGISDFRKKALLKQKGKYDWLDLRLLEAQKEGCHDSCATGKGY